MAAGCCGGCAPGHKPEDKAYRRILWIVLALNGGMFTLELAAGTAAGSASLQADALDFLADAANYAISLAVLGLALRWRAGAALVKGLSLGLLGLWVAGQTAWNALYQTVPQADIMGVVGLLALATNLCSALLLYVHRNGDANRRSVWICSRNDAIANLAVLGAAAGVFGTGTGWPDVAVAGIMAALALTGAAQIVRQAVPGIVRAAEPFHAGTLKIGTRPVIAAARPLSTNMPGQSITQPGFSRLPAKAAEGG